MSSFMLLTVIFITLAKDDCYHGLLCMCKCYHGLIINIIIDRRTSTAEHWTFNTNAFAVTGFCTQREPFFPGKSIMDPLGYMRLVEISYTPRFIERTLGGFSTS